MNRFLGVLALGLVASLPARAETDPLADARDGKLQCYAPDAARKTCKALAAYLIAPDGTINNPAVVLVAPNPVIVMHVVSPVEIRDGAICGVARAEDIDAASIEVAGHPASPEEEGPIKAQIKNSIAPRIGKMICTSYLPGGDHLTAQVTVDGAPQPQLSASVIWVSREDGYRVSP
jgi:hypothetical protein